MRFNEVKKLIKEDEELFEINMSPSNLDKLTSQIDALAGMEFEMIVPKTGDSYDDFESEPNYDHDERVDSIDDAVDFFSNYGNYVINSRDTVNDLRDRMQNDYEEWLDEKSFQEWQENTEDAVYQYVRLNFSDANVVELLNLEADAEGNLPDIGKAEFQKAADIIARDEIEPYYEEAKEAFMDGFRDNHPEDEWLSSEDLEYMSDIENRYEITWPHWTEYEDDEANGQNIDEVANNFQKAIGRPVNASNRYHSARRESGHYVVEPDGSLEPDNSSEQGLEFVSPPLPLNDLLSDLEKVKKWADDNGCYTNESTGLHINVSVPGLKGTDVNLDYVKLALLLGDERVLNEFGRAGNSYCESAMKIIRDRVAQRPEDAEALLTQMKQHLGDIATKVIHSGTTKKYTSINTKGGYVEFRSPGGDWLNANFDMIVPTLKRFVVALDAAVDPDKYRQEYLKKLYKLLAPKTKDDTLSYFAKFAAGELPKAALKSFIKQAQLERSLKKGSAAQSQTNTTNPTGRPSNPDGNWILYATGEHPIRVLHRFMASGLDDARNVIDQWVRATGQEIRDVGVHYDPTKQYGQPGGAGNSADMQAYEIYDRQSGHVPVAFMAHDASSALARLERYKQEHPGGNYGVRLARPAVQRYAVKNAAGSTVHYVEARTQDGAELIAYQWLRSENPEINVNEFTVELAPEGEQQHTSDAIPGSTIDLQRQRQAQAAQSAGQFTGEWKIVDANDRELHRFGGIGNVQADANRIAIEWLRQNPRYMQSGVSVLPVMS
jgi:hypothetical protein